MQTPNDQIFCSQQCYQFLILLITTAVVFCFFSDHVYQLHSQWFHISREVFDALFCGLMGIYKLFFWVFNLVPLIALLIINKCCHKIPNCSSKDSSCYGDGQNGPCCKCSDCSCSCQSKAALNK